MKVLGNDYLFEVVLVPLLGGDAIYHSLQLWCARDREKSLEQLMNGVKPTGEIFPTCDKKPVMNSLGLASLLRLKGLPHMIRLDGLQLAGAPDDIKEFMKRNVDSIGEVKVNGSK
jgi:hypothetical protein